MCRWTTPWPRISLRWLTRIADRIQSAWRGHAPGCRKRSRPPALASRGGDSRRLSRLTQRPPNGYSLIYPGRSAMGTAEHREPYESRGSRTDLRALGSEARICGLIGSITTRVCSPGDAATAEIPHLVERLTFASV